MWKLFSGMLAEEIYEHLEGKNLFPHELKGCKKKSRGTKDKLLIDKTILRNCKNRKVNLTMPWIDYRKACDMIPHSWILECMRLTGVSENIIQMVENIMQNWKTMLTSAGKELAEIHIRRGIFQGDSLSPLLFVICLIPMSLALRKVKAGYSFGNDKRKVNHLGRQKIVNMVQCVEPSDYKEAEKLKGMQNWKNNDMLGQFVGNTEPASDKEKSSGWLRNGDLKKETEGMILAAQGQALRTNYVKFRINHSCVSPKCRMCGDKDETVWHAIGECSKLAGTEYKRRHDNVARIIHRALCIKYGFSTAERWYEHNPEKILESCKVKIFWDLIVIDKTSRECYFIEITCPLDWSILERENFKVEKYQDLKREVAKLWNVRPVVIPVVVGTLGMVTNRLEGFIRKIGVDVSVELLQKACLLGTARILRRVLEA